MVRIKICGVTSLAEAFLAEQKGADAAGLLVGRVHASSDFVEPRMAKEIALALPPFITPVLVTHLERPRAIKALAEAVPCPVVQLHSDLSPSVLKNLRPQLRSRKVIGKVSVEDVTALDRALKIQPFVDAIVLDSRDRVTDRVGGTGITHDWSISARIVSACRVPIILAGGLTSENVAAAIMAVRPWGVDVNSGVETDQKTKNAERMRRFITAARSA
jgi:phosphoribosylanthranilate isomerase